MRSHPGFDTSLGQISQRSTSLILSRADKTKKVLWNLFDMPATPLCLDVFSSW